MAIDLRTSLVAAAVVLGCAVVVVVRVALASEPTPRRRATESERIELAQIIASSEFSWTNETTQNFPSDRWSQRDDFHSREYHKVQELAKERGVNIEDVLRAIDDDIHRRAARNDGAPDDRNARAVPCKPRAFYD